VLRVIRVAFDISQHVRYPALGVEHLVKINTFLTDKSQVVANRAIRRKVLQGNEPASTVMIAETVDGKWLLEIEAIAAE
jgi:enamine deaminase RidA (YjgF/YER057c/UK114 family)